MTVEEFAELSAGHALGALSPDDERAFQAALVAHPEWAAIATMDADTAAALADTAPPVAPPLNLRTSILAQVAAQAAAEATADDPSDDEPVREAPTTDTAQTVQRRTWTKALFGLVASMVLLVGLGWGVGSLSNLWQTPADVIALEQIEAAPDADSATIELDSGATATAHWSASLGSVVMVMNGMSALPEDQTYELWFVRGETPVSAGTFAVSGDTTTAELDGEMQPGDTIAVTVEPAGGAPDGVPTSAPILAIATA
ncbi:anti-sigma factor [Microbacterium sp. W1N]|uniref:anti-sigma factor n=1 Tax=Microbacterium festucae TaxID=2977531 RepID=UPI0021C1C1E6|nr:anti-sigma factor [Microbacterium festucae]MCT9821039.1 anti-sigma factor [Microbacterium festucae]